MRVTPAGVLPAAQREARGFCACSPQGPTGLPYLNPFKGSQGRAFSRSPQWSVFRRGGCPGVLLPAPSGLSAHHPVPGHCRASPSRPPSQDQTRTQALGLACSWRQLSGGAAPGLQGGREPEAQGPALVNGGVSAPSVQRTGCSWPCTRGHTLPGVSAGGQFS